MSKTVDLKKYCPDFIDGVRGIYIFNRKCQYLWRPARKDGTIILRDKEELVIDIICYSKKDITVVDMMWVLIE